MYMIGQLRGPISAANITCFFSPFGALWCVRWVPFGCPSYWGVEGGGWRVVCWWWWWQVSAPGARGGNAPMGQEAICPLLQEGEVGALFGSFPFAFVVLHEFGNALEVETAQH